MSEITYLGNAYSSKEYLEEMCTVNTGDCTNNTCTGNTGDCGTNSCTVNFGDCTTDAYSSEPCSAKKYK